MSINRFLSRVAADGGMSSSNNFIVKFGRAKAISPPSGFDEMTEFFCDEAQLPNINTAEGQMNGLYLGSGQLKYPHTRVFTELQLGFTLTANMEILKYLNSWHDYIFGERPNPSNPKVQNRVNRLAYMDDYVCDIYIQKTEIGPSSTTQRNPITYVIERAYPYAIDAVPLQFGSTQLTKVTAQFSYMRHYTKMSDTRNISDSIIPAGGVLVGEVEIGPGRFKQEWLLPNGKIVTTEGSKRATGTAPSAPPKTVPAPAPAASTRPVDPREAARLRGT